MQGLLVALDVTLGDEHARQREQFEFVQVGRLVIRAYPGLPYPSDGCWQITLSQPQPRPVRRHVSHDLRRLPTSHGLFRLQQGVAGAGCIATSLFQPRQAQVRLPGNCREPSFG